MSAPKSNRNLTDIEAAVLAAWVISSGPHWTKYVRVPMSGNSARVTLYRVKKQFGITSKQKTLDILAQNANWRKAVKALTHESQSTEKLQAATNGIANHRILSHYRRSDNFSPTSIAIQ